MKQHRHKYESNWNKMYTSFFGKFKFFKECITTVNFNDFHNFLSKMILNYPWDSEPQILGPNNFKKPKKGFWLVRVRSTSLKFPASA